jgi:type I restriction enzyme R subunit
LKSLGYTHLYGPDIERDYHNPLYIDVLTEQIPTINKSAHKAAIEEAISKITHIEPGTLIQQNKMFTDWLQNGVEVSYQDKGETKTDIIKLIDYDNPTKNTFHVINQWTVIESENKRPAVCGKIPV